MRGKSAQWIIGVDEVGRGPLAGPVVVAAAAGPPQVFRRCQLRKMRDSKKLSAKQREKWFLFLTSHPKIEWSVARVWPRVIDRINISQAANLGARRVCTRLSLVQTPYIVLDGGLRLPPYVRHEAVIRGDEKIPAIAAASIIAKVTRDRIMLRLHKKYPQYRFDLHKGYGTKLHYVMLAQFGPVPMHRQTFLK